MNRCVSWRCRGAKLGNLVATSSVLSACGKAFAWRHALWLCPTDDLVSCSAVMSACERGSQWPLALVIFGDLRRRQVVDLVSWNGALAAVQRAGRSDLAQEMLREMEEQRIRPNLVSAWRKKGVKVDLKR